LGGYLSFFWNNNQEMNVEVYNGVSVEKGYELVAGALEKT
jgi:hypothetical protein